MIYLGSTVFSVSPSFQLSLTLSSLKMSRSTALGLLSNGSNGDEILAILNVIVEIESEKTINDIADLLFD